MKQIRIRLYRIQDYDLYVLYYDPHFDLQGAFRKVISAYVKGEPRPVIEVGDIKPLIKGNKACAVMSFTLTDEDEIRLLEDASRTWRNMNNFCKSLLRRSLAGLDTIYGLEEFPDPMHAEANTFLQPKKRRTSLQGEKKESKKKEKPQNQQKVVQNTSIKNETPSKQESFGWSPSAGKIDPFAMIAKWSEE